MIFREYVEDELRRANMLDESIVKLGPDIRDKQYRANHLETNRHDTRIQHLKNGDTKEVKMTADEIRNRRRAQIQAQHKRNQEMSTITAKHALAMLKRRIMNLRQHPDIKLDGTNT